MALVALFRPGPLQSGMVDNFINRKHGREGTVSFPDSQYQHEWLKPILKPTYGIILYQEQVMQIAQELAGYTPGGCRYAAPGHGQEEARGNGQAADDLLKMAPGQGRGWRFGQCTSSTWWEKFAGYASTNPTRRPMRWCPTRTAWLKTHYAAPFMAAVMSSEMDNTDKIVVFVDECKRMKLSLKLPDVNEGDYMFTVNAGDEIIYGLGAVKGAGRRPYRKYACHPKGRCPFLDLFDFCARTDPRRVNRRAIDALIRSGSFDTLGVERWVLMASLEDALKAAEQSANNRDSGIDDLFGEVVPAQGKWQQRCLPPLSRSSPLDGQGAFGG